MYEGFNQGARIFLVISAWTVVITGLVVRAPPVYASQSTSQFDVYISISAGGAGSNTDICRSSTQIGAFGRSVTIICSSGEIVDFSGDTSGLPWTKGKEGAYRFVTVVPSSEEELDTVQRYSGLGPVSNWHMVRLVDRAYLELTIIW